MGKLLMVVSLAAAFVLASTGTAGAWWAEGSSFRSPPQGWVQVFAEPGEQLDLRAFELPIGIHQVDATRGLILEDSSAPVTDPPAGRGDGCVKLDDHTLSCHGLDGFGSPVSISYLDLQLGDGDDRVRIPATSSPMFTIGDTGAGNDTLELNTEEGAALTLGDGNDRITLRGSGASFLPTDSVQGGAGDDVLRVVNLATDDNPDCGDGNDVLYADLGEASAGCETVHTFP